MCKNEAIEVREKMKFQGHSCLKVHGVSIVGGRRESTETS